MRAILEQMNGLREQLVPVSFESLDVDFTHGYGPEASGAGFVPEIDGLVGGADEQALAGFKDFTSPVFWKVSFLGLGQEFFQGMGFDGIEGGHFRDFDQPFSPEVHR